MFTFSMLHKISSQPAVFELTDCKTSKFRGEIVNLPNLIENKMTKGTNTKKINFLAHKNLKTLKISQINSDMTT